MEIYMDEAGRWPLYWPLRIWLVSNKISEKQLKKHELFKDSKQLTPKKREKAFEEILELADKSDIIYEIWTISSEFIDTYWITRAINTAISKALYRMLSKLLNQKIKKTIKRADILKLIDNYQDKTKDTITLIIDWKNDFWISKELNIKTKTIVHWDAEKVQISMASILAKVSRDKILDKTALKYPEYNFEKHKGYWTKLHYKAIEEHWVLPEHRKLFLKKIFPDWKILKFNDSISFDSN